VVVVVPAVRALIDLGEQDGEGSAASKEDLQDQVLFEAKLYVLVRSFIIAGTA
jgi:hypothetical protein